MAASPTPALLAMAVALGSGAGEVREVRKVRAPGPGARPPARVPADSRTGAPADSLIRLLDFAGLAALDTDVVCGQFSSSDPAGRGDDHGHFLRLEGKRAVLAEMEGPGVIARLWSANAGGRLQIFLDGEATPRIDCPFQELFTGRYAPFCEPIAIHQGGGWISYFPIPYAQSCRVEVAELEEPAALYYQVQYVTWPKGTPMRTFTRELPDREKHALAEVLAEWANPLESARRFEEDFMLGPDAPAHSLEWTAGEASPIPTNFRGGNDLTPQRQERGKTRGIGRQRIAPRQEVMFRALDWPESVVGAGCIDSMFLKVLDPTPSRLRGLVLELQTHPSRGPTCSVPVADLFNVGFGADRCHGLLLGWQGNSGYCRFPIPYLSIPRIRLRNTTDEPIDATIELSMRRLPRAEVESLGVFHAEYRTVDQVGNELYEFCRVEGPGKFVGVNLSLQGVGDLWYLEGNEQLFVDGETTPSILGTGSEDYFNGGWYWDSGPLSLPLHGLGVKEEWTTNRTTPWRHQLPDAVPFRTGFVGKIEHGSSNAVRDACYSSVAFWYGKEQKAVHRVTDAEARLPRQWVKRPRGSIAAVAMAWTAESRFAPTPWEEVSSDWRGAPFNLYQGFPVSYYERDHPVPPGFAMLSVAVATARFNVDEGDRYRLRLQIVGRPGGVDCEAAIDGKRVGRFETNSASVRPLETPELGVVGLAAGAHELSLRPASGAPASADPWLGVNALLLESVSPFVKEWWVAPPVDCDPKGSVEQVPPSEPSFLAAGFDPSKAGWKEITHESGEMDLNALVTPRAPVFGYLMTYVFAPAARTARVRLGSDDGVRVWVNGALAWSNAVHRPITIDADHFDLELDAGWNALLVKVKNDDGGYSLALRLADPDGMLRCATRPK